MIKVNCFTNLNVIKEVWPTEMPAVPRVGDYIESVHSHLQSDRMHFQLTLKVIAVTWKYSEYDKWVPEIELHIRHSYWSIKDFFKWYAPLVRMDVSYFV